jgi:hypothetical protein
MLKLVGRNVENARVHGCARTPHFDLARGPATTSMLHVQDCSGGTFVLSVLTRRSSFHDWETCEMLVWNVSRLKKVSI